MRRFDSSSTSTGPGDLEIAAKTEAAMLADVAAGPLP
jgi:hypothetical protein